MDELGVRINGGHHILWRAVDQEGMVIDILMHVWTAPAVQGKTRTMWRSGAGAVMCPAC